VLYGTNKNKLISVFEDTLKQQRNEKPNHHQDSNPIRINPSDSHAVIIMQQH
jgi:hypothetical protein